MKKGIVKNNKMKRKLERDNELEYGRKYEGKEDDIKTRLKI